MILLRRWESKKLEKAVGGSEGGKPLQLFGVQSPTRGCVLYLSYGTKHDMDFTGGGEAKKENEISRLTKLLVTPSHSFSWPH